MPKFNSTNFKTVSTLLEPGGIRLFSDSDKLIYISFALKEQRPTL